MSIITHTLHSLSTYPITSAVLSHLPTSFISTLTLSHSPLTPTSLSHITSLSPSLSHLPSLSPSCHLSPFHPHTFPSPSHLPSSLHPHTSPLPFTLTPPLSLSPSPFHQLTWSPTDTTRCFSTLGLARQNQQTPGGSFSGQRLFGTGASEVAVGQQ